MMREHRRRERETKPGRRRSGVLLTLAGLLAVLALGGVPLLAQKGLGGGQKPAAPSGGEARKHSHQPPNRPTAQKAAVWMHIGTKVIR